MRAAEFPLLSIRRLWPETSSLICCCNIGEMSRKVPVKCAIAGCHRRLRMTLAQREELRRVGRENNAAAGLEIWPESLVQGDDWDEFRQ